MYNTPPDKIPGGAYAHTSIHAHTHINILNSLYGRVRITMLAVNKKEEKYRDYQRLREGYITKDVQAVS